jgi:hypothetical protein
VHISRSVSTEDGYMNVLGVDDDLEVALFVKRIIEREEG